MAFPSAAGYGNLPNGNFSPTVFSMNVLKKFRRASVAQDITNTAYFGEIANYGDSVKILLEPDVQVSDYVRGQEVIPTELLDDNITLTVDQAKKFSFAVDDIEAKQANVNWMDLATDRAMYKMRLAFDANVLTYMVSQATLTSGTTGSPTIIVATSPSSGQFTPLGLLNRIKTLFDEADIPEEDRCVVAPPAFWEVMGDENSKLIPVNVTGMSESPLLNGKVIAGMIRGFTPYMSNNLPSGGTGFRDGSGYGTVLAVHRSAVATASQIAKTESFRSPSTFADVVRGLLLFGRKALRTEAVYRAYVRLG